MKITIHFADGSAHSAASITPPSTIPFCRYPAQSDQLGKRIEVVAESSDGLEPKTFAGTILRADMASTGLHLAMLDNGVVLGWSENGVWGLQRSSSDDLYIDPNWGFPYVPGSPVPNGTVQPFFPSTAQPPISLELAHVEEDEVVARAALETDRTYAQTPLQKITEWSADTNHAQRTGPWLYLPFTGTYDGVQSKWFGWIEDETRSWIAFVGRCGLGVVWRERGEEGEVKGEALAFIRDVGTYPTTIVPRRRGAVKKVRYHRGLEIHIDRPMGTVIEGVGPDGKPYVFQQHCDYGYFPGTLGDDLDEFDVYMGPNPVAKNVFIIEQLRARSGWWDERKAIVGCDSADEALRIYKSHVHPRMVGRIGTISHETFEESLLAHQKSFAETKKSARVPFVPITNEDIAELAEMQALLAELEGEWGKGVEGEQKDGDTASNFPGPGDKKSVSLRNSRFVRFDVDYAQDLKQNHSKVWELGGNIGNNKQFDVLSRAQRQGGAPHTAAEATAILMRERWATRHFEETRAPGIVAQIKWVVVGKLGEPRMKKLIAKEKDKHGEKSAIEREPLSFPPPSDDFNPPDEEPTSVPPIGEPSPSSATQAFVSNAQPSTVDPMMVIPPLAPPKEIEEPAEKDADVGPLSRRIQPIHPTSAPTMSNATQTSVHHSVHRIVIATLALAAAGAISLPADEHMAFRNYIGGLGDNAAGVPQHKEANPSGVPGRAGQVADGLIHRKATEINASDSIANIDLENREITFIASTPTVDSHGEVVLQEWLFDRFKSNPVILWAHNQREPPIGRAVKWWVENGEVLYIRVRFSQVNPFAQLIFDMIIEGMIRACSVGFIPHEISRREVDGQLRTALGKNELCELSVCPVPSNADAVIPKEIEQALSARYEQCAVAVERRLAALADKANGQTNNNHNAVPANGERVVGQSTGQRVPTAAPASHLPSTTTKSGGVPMVPRGKAMTIIDQTYATTQVRKEGSLAHRCNGCGAEGQIALNGVRERIIELETKCDVLEQKRAMDLSALKNEEDKRKVVERERDELKVKMTEIELAPLVGPDPWNITPATARSLAELRVRNGEEPYQMQLTAQRDQSARVKGLADELTRIKNAPAPPPPPVPGQAPTTVMSGLNAPGNGAPEIPATKTIDPVLGFLNG